MIRVTIEWSYPHHPGDGYDMIASHLAAGYDEGPLLIVPVGGRSRPGRGPEVLMFADVQSYLAHIAAHEGDLEGDRWAGLVRRAAREDPAPLLAALDHVKQLIGPARPGPKSRLGRALPPAPDHAVLTGPFSTKSDLVIWNIGDGFPDIAAAFPALTEEMHFPSEEEW